MKLSTIVLFLTLTATTVSAFDKIIAYGDSYSDNGNDYLHSKFPPAPPYWEGRFSNGPTWLEHVNENLTGIEIVNVCNGGATLNNADVYSEFNGWIVPGFIQQVLTTFVNGTSDDLYLLFHGHNDMISIARPDQYNVVNKNYTKEAAAANFVKGTKLLVDLYGAKNFLIINLSPFDKWPVIPESEKEQVGQMVVDFNALVKEMTPKALPNATIKFLDIHGWMEDKLAHPESVGQSNSNGPCAWGIGNTTACSDPEKHFFWDSYHPSKEVHAALGAWAFKQIVDLYNIKLN
ncbi:GDSL lipase/esterase [Parasitella parasitica]|nr:GDSL lipase/esterase [Parasitella parasitica]